MVVFVDVQHLLALDTQDAVQLKARSAACVCNMGGKGWTGLRTQRECTQSGLCDGEVVVVSRDSRRS
jgi:hypothetical protein